LTPSALLKAKHQFKPRSNQRCACGEAVEMVLEWLPRLKRSILSHSSIDPRDDRRHYHRHCCARNDGDDLIPACFITL
jgi:hypothetical protein